MERLTQEKGIPQGELEKIGQEFIDEEAGERIGRFPEMNWMSCVPINKKKW